MGPNFLPMVASLCDIHFPYPSSPVDMVSDAGNGVGSPPFGPRSYCITDASRASVLTEVLSAWEARANAIQTLSVRARFFRKGKTSLKPLTADRISDFVAKHEGIRDAAEASKSLIENLRADSLARQPLWVEVEYAKDGERVSERTSDVMVSDERGDVRAERNHGQVEVFRRGENPYTMLPLDAFSWELSSRSTAGLSLLEYSALTARLGGTTGDAVIEVTVDRRTNIARRVSIRSKGTIIGNVFQLGALECSDGVVFPEITLETRYANGLLETARLLSPIEVDVNVGLPESTFSVPATAGERLLDARSGTTRIQPIEHDVTDVHSEIVAEASPHESSARRYFAAIAVVLILILAMRLCLRRRRSADA